MEVKHILGDKDTGYVPLKKIMHLTSGIQGQKTFLIDLSGAYTEVNYHNDLDYTTFGNCGIIKICSDKEGIWCLTEDKIKSLIKD